MEKTGDTWVVSIDEYSLGVLQDKLFYATKRDIPKGIVYIAFYQKGDPGKIVFYGKIKVIEQGGVEDVGGAYWMRNFPEREPPYNIIRFENIRKLRKQIIRDTKLGVQGPMTTSMNVLNASTKLSQVFLKFPKKLEVKE